MNNKFHILTLGQCIAEKYKVSFFIKKGSYAEAYRVKDQKGKTKLLKLFLYPKLHRAQFVNDGDVLEIEILKRITHPNVVKYSDSGELLIGNTKYAYVVLDFISGETLADKMGREQTLNQYESKDIILGVLNGLSYLHNHEDPIIHNDITNLNIMLDLSGNVTIPKIIDFGFSRYLKQSNKSFLKDGLNPFYQANEAYNNIFSAQNDVFSVGALYYHLLEGLPPWFVEISRCKTDRIKLEEIIIEKRNKPLKFENNIDEQTQKIITKALQPDMENRFISVDQFIQAINGEIKIQELFITPEKPKSRLKEVKSGRGFSAIAGMQELKETIQLDVIDALNEKERYAEYGLTIPNGMLLYGPPGCGKTFFAERMAEEMGFNFYSIKPSDVQSKFVNASQENVKELFDEARENAASVIFIDELDAMVPNRNNSNLNHMNTAVVNEFLAQMNNSGEDGVFVIGATNRPLAIDPAILRAGRLDKTIYLPPPDFDARKLMFKLYLEKRPREVGLDYGAFAKETENFVSSDIKFLCDEASRKALKMDSKISNKIFLEIINNNRSSISLEELNHYVAINAKIEGIAGNNNGRSRIGF